MLLRPSSSVASGGMCCLLNREAAVADCAPTVPTWALPTLGIEQFAFRAGRTYGTPDRATVPFFNGGFTRTPNFKASVLAMKLGRCSILASCI